MWSFAGLECSKDLSIVFIMIGIQKVFYYMFLYMLNVLLYFGTGCSTSTVSKFASVSEQCSESSDSESGIFRKHNG